MAFEVFGADTPSTFKTRLKNVLRKFTRLSDVDKYLECWRTTLGALSSLPLPDHLYITTPSHKLYIFSLL